MSETHIDWLALGREVLDVEIEGLEAVRDNLGQGFVLAVETLACCAGRVVVTGVGKSGLVGRKIAATFSSTGTAAAFLHPVEAAHGDLGMIRPGDVVLAISNSGETDELNAILPSLRALGATVIALTGQLDSAMAGLADVVVGVHVPREACPHNLAPTASTTAALAVGDALAVCLINWKDFGEADFLRCHPGGVLGQRLSLPVAQLMHVDNLPLVGPTETVEAALEAMNAGGLGFVGVVDGDSRLAGVFSDGDVRRLLAKGPVLRSLPIAELMTRDPLRVAPGERAGRALDVMESRQITVLPVVDEDRLVGMVHLHDLLGKGRVRFG